MSRRYDPNSIDLVDTLQVNGHPDELRGKGYICDKHTAEAINVALALGRPLLISGEPGCGKTELGFSIARRLKIPSVHFFVAKSDSTARSLFYEYDTLARFQAAYGGSGANTDAGQYITFNALGRAILEAHGLGAVEEIVKGTDFIPPAEGASSVVVIDEIDKAPRDFPNDLLDELDRMQFRIPEFRAAKRAVTETPSFPPSPDKFPIIVITSNNERQLPDAFLRRCVFRHIEFPDVNLLEIVKKHLERGSLSMDPGELRMALNATRWSREGGLKRKPGLAEIIDLACAMAQDQSDGSLEDRMGRAIGTLAKDKADQATLRDKVTEALSHGDGVL